MRWVIILVESHIDCCSDFEVSQIEMLVVDLSAVIDEDSGVEALGLQADLESNFLPMGIAHSASAENADHLFKHLDNSADENDDSNVEMCQQILKHSIATLIFISKINLVRRNLNKTNQNDFN